MSFFCCLLFLKHGWFQMQGVKICDFLSSQRAARSLFLRNKFVTCNCILEKNRHEVDNAEKTEPSPKNQRQENTVQEKKLLGKNKTQPVERQAKKDP